ncbi:LysR family transcriptional regulator [Rahnella aquatilis]|uniref:LysR family transcriptional regulator n=1 Tax=Rahnella aquatilis TaxID=34038 RepID=UPI000647CE29|nr:LysR family transcriptional regulator [Rahnella aquatilis]
MALFSTKRIKYFICVMERNSFILAANDLCITRSPLSKIIQDFEEDIGSKLFERNYNRVIATDLAVQLYSQLKPIYLSLIKLEEVYNKKTKKISVIFDLMFSDETFQYISSALKSEKTTYIIKQLQLTDLVIEEIFTNPFSILVSLKNIPTPEHVNKETYTTDTLCVIASTLCNRKLNDINLPILIKYGKDFEKIKRWYAELLPPVINKPIFLGHDDDISGILYNVYHHRGIAVLTKKMAYLYKIPGIDIIELPYNRIKKYIYTGKSVKKDKEFINFVRQLNILI